MEKGDTMQRPWVDGISRSQHLPTTLRTPWPKAKKPARLVSGFGHSFLTYRIPTMPLTARCNSSLKQLTAVMTEFLPGYGEPERPKCHFSTAQQEVNLCSLVPSS